MTKTHCPACAQSYWLADGTEHPCPGCASCAEKDQRILSLLEREKSILELSKTARDEKDQRIAALEAATRRVVEVMKSVKQFIENGVELGYIEPLISEPESLLLGQVKAALADPVIVALRREA
jgi:hypothetical protein